MNSSANIRILFRQGWCVEMYISENDLENGHVEYFDGLTGSDKDFIIDFVKDFKFCELGDSQIKDKSTKESIESIFVRLKEKHPVSKYSQWDFSDVPLELFGTWNDGQCYRCCDRISLIHFEREIYKTQVSL